MSVMAISFKIALLMLKYEFFCDESQICLIKVLSWIVF